MDIYGKISDKVKNIAQTKKLGISPAFTARVKSISGNTCTVILDEMEITDVRLRAVVNNNTDKILVTPSIGSYVLVVDLSGGEYRNLAVIGYSEIDGIEIITGNTKIEVNNGSIVFNGGGLDGLVKINELTQKLNDLVQAFNTHIHTTTATIGTGPVGSISAPTQTAQNFSKSDYENNKIKQ
jgi:hypothetical protein